MNNFINFKFSTNVYTILSIFIINFINILNLFELLQFQNVLWLEILEILIQNFSQAFYFSIKTYIYSHDIFYKHLKFEVSQNS